MYNLLITRAISFTQSVSEALGFTPTGFQKEIRDININIQKLVNFRPNDLKDESLEFLLPFKKLNYSILYAVAMLYKDAGVIFDNEKQDHQAIKEYRKAHLILSFIEDEDFSYSLERIHAIDDLAVRMNYRKEFVPKLFAV